MDCFTGKEGSLTISSTPVTSFPCGRVTYTQSGLGNDETEIAFVPERDVGTHERATISFADFPAATGTFDLGDGDPQRVCYTNASFTSYCSLYCAVPSGSITVDSLSEEGDSDKIQIAGSFTTPGLCTVSGNQIYSGVAGTFEIY